MKCNKCLTFRLKSELYLKVLKYRLFNLTIQFDKRKKVEMVTLLNSLVSFFRKILLIFFYHVCIETLVTKCMPINVFKDR